MQQAYYEGLAEDGVLEMAEGGMAVDEGVTTSSPAPAATTSRKADSVTESLDPFADLDKFAALGVTVRK